MSYLVRAKIEPLTQVKASAVTVGSTLASVTPTPLPRRRVLVVQNIGTNPAYLGDAAVTADTGLCLGAGEMLELPLAEGAGLYAVAPDVGGTQLRVLEGA